MKLCKLSMVFMVAVLFFTSAARGSDVRDLPYQYVYEVAKDQTLDTFVICDTCPDRPGLKKATFRPVSNVLSIKVPGPQSPAFQVAKAEPAESKPVAKVTEQAKPQNVTCPKETKTVQSKLGGVVLFSFGESDLDKANRRMLDSIADRVSPGSSVSVYGYTCDIGSDNYNDKLSQERAEMVAAYLKTKGLNVDKAQGRGKTSPLSAVHKELNRRAEVNIKNMDIKTMEGKKE